MFHGPCSLVLITLESLDHHIDLGYCTVLHMELVYVQFRGTFWSR
jgi:hypothetical protein